MAFKIYTKTGDTGETALFGGTRLPKHHLRIEAYGTVDELNSYIGVVRDAAPTEATREVLKTIQDRLFTLGANLASDGEYKVIPDLHPEDVTLLEREIDAMDEVLPPLKNFILPGGHTTVSFCHVARCVCRRAERLVVALHETDPVEPIILQYLNRLSDYLFALSRMSAHELEVEEIAWVPRAKKA
jgi:cob(I)alamin adenosyltransferase